MIKGIEFRYLVDNEEYTPEEWIQYVLIGATRVGHDPEEVLDTFNTAQDTDEVMVCGRCCMLLEKYDPFGSAYIDAVLPEDTEDM